LETLAIGFSERLIRFTELNEKGDVLFIGKTETDFDLNKDLSAYRSSEEIISETGDLIYNILQENNVQPDRIGVLFDTTQSFLNVIPIDYKEETSSIHSQILWELSNYFPDNYKDFKISYHKLNHNSYTGQVKDTLIIAVNKSKINLIKKIFSVCNLKIHLTDIDQFASVKCIREICKEELTNNQILAVGCKKNRIDLSIIDEKSLIYYDYLVFENYKFQESLRRTIEKLGSMGIRFNRMLLCGDDCTKNVYDFLKLNYKECEVEFSDPFKKLGSAIEIKEEIDSESNGFKYTPLDGLALKGF